MQTNAAESVSSPQLSTEQPPKKENARAGDQSSSAVSNKNSKPSNQKPKIMPKPAAQASRPSKFLPSERITFSRQLDILRGWAAASGPLHKTVNNNEVAKIVDAQPSTVSINNAFYSSVGLLSKADGGYVPAEELTAFLRAYEWNKDTAAQKLAPVLSKAWFYEALGSKLEFGPRTEADCLQDLADVASAGPDYRPNLRMLIEYLIAAGLIQRDGGMLKKGSAAMATATIPATNNTEPPPVPNKQDTPTAPNPAASMMPSLFGTTEGQVQFNIAVKVNMGEFATWQADRIAAFFGGIAQVLAAKAKVEEMK